MAYDLGDVVPITLSIKDSLGAAANAGAVTLTITLPDNTTATPSVTNPVTGTYQCDYTPTLTGLHKLRWVATGVNAGAYTDSFLVDDLTDVSVVSLAELKLHMNTPTGTTYDAELREVLASATSVCQDYIGRPIARQTFTETHDGGGDSLRLRQTPAIAVTSVTESGTLLTASDYVLDTSASMLWRGTTTSTYAWVSGVQNISVVYTAGYVDPPYALRMAVRRMAEHLWTRSQQAPHPALGAQFGSAVGDETMPKSTYLLPYSVQSLLNPYRTAGF